MKVAHLIKTKSIKSDGRLLKWLKSLKDEDIISEVFILEDKNESSEYFINNIRVISTSLFFRKLFQKRKGYIFKVPEFTIKSLFYFKRSSYSVYVFHDVQHYLTLFFICLFKKWVWNKSIVWDLHELPHGYLSRIFITKKVIQYILSNVDLVVYTNNERRQCILNDFSFREPKYVTLNNYPEESFISAPKASISPYLRGEFETKPYILWMGAALKARNFPSVLNSFKLWNKDINLVVMGAVELEMQLLIEKENLSNRVFSKFVEQDEIVHIVDNALLSIVLYKHSSKNNYYCEPNRLYQLITRNIPVIVGNNPPMKVVVENYEAGVVLPDDGSNEKSLVLAMDQLYNKIIAGDFKRNKDKKFYLRELCWDNQFHDLVSELRLLNKLKRK